MDRKAVKFEMKNVLDASKFMAQMEPMNSRWMKVGQQWDPPVRGAGYEPSTC